MPLSHRDLDEVIRSYVKDSLPDTDFVSDIELIEVVSDIVRDFSIGKEVRYWIIPADDDTSPEDITNTLVMRLVAELIKDKKVLVRYPEFKFSHNKETKKIEKVGIEYEFRPIP